MRQTGAAGVGLSPPRFKRLLTIFLDFAGLFGCTASLLCHFGQFGRDWRRLRGINDGAQGCNRQHDGAGRFGHDLGARG